MTEEIKQAKKRGRPPIDPSLRRSYRGNLLLTAEEEGTLKAMLRALSEAEGKRVTGAELIRRLVVPHLEAFNQETEGSTEDRDNIPVEMV